MKPIANIFSKSKLQKVPKCPNPKTTIIVDTREKQSMISANLIEQKANIEYEKLEIGDYLIGNTIIERKTFSDFANSMINKRLISQLQEIKKYPKYFLIVEGFYYNYREFNIHENAIRGMFLSVAIDFQVPIVFTENEKDTANFLILTAKKYEKPNQENSLRQSKTANTIEEQKQFILEGFPGIGPVTARELLREFKSLQGIFNATGKRLDKIKEFDENKIKKFRELLEGQN